MQISTVGELQKVLELLPAHGKVKILTVNVNPNTPENESVNSTFSYPHGTIEIHKDKLILLLS